VDEFAVADVVATEQEAELLGGLLRSAGIKCIVRQTNFGAGASDGMPTGGPYEVIVRAEDLAAAREVLGKDHDPHRVSGDG
jgi:putative signal transducing protein